MVEVGTDKHAGARGPEDLLGIVILVFVDLKILEHATAAEGIAILVDEAATGACIFKLFLVMVRQNLGLAGRNLRVGIHQLYDGLNPMRCHLNIRVEQHIILSLNLP